MIIDQEQAMLKTQSEFVSMLTMLKQASDQGLQLHEVEANLWERLLKIGHLSVEAFISSQGTGDLGPTLEYEGRTMKRLNGFFEARYVSVFGEHMIPRTAYGTRLTQKLEVIPLDARLGLPDSEFSYLLQDWDQSLCVHNSYGQSRHTIRKILGLDQSVASMETMSRSMAAHVDSFHANQPSPEPVDKDSIVVLTADGKGVPMRRDIEKDGPSPKGRLKRGEKAGKKREACVGAVYTVDRFKRTAQDVVDEVLRKRKQSHRPHPENKRLRAELTEIVDGKEVKGKQRIFTWFTEELALRTPTRSAPVVCVMDGDSNLWRMANQVLGQSGIAFVCILDLYHALEYLWKAAYCFHKEGSPEATAFVTDRLTRMLEGKIGYVIGGLKQMATKQGLSQYKKKELTKTLTYFQNNRKYMKYNEYLRAGYPIGSGVVEGACRHLVKDRMELTGMRWRVAGAQAILKLRAVSLNDDWEAFQQDYREESCRKLYPYRDFIMSKYKKAG
jgi:hypothetical protein